MSGRIHLDMSYDPTTDTRFLGRLEEWLLSQGEKLVMIRFANAGGAKSFEFFSSYQTLVDRLRGLPAQTCVIAFRQPQLPLRGVVDDEFIDACLACLSDGKEFLVVDLEPCVHGRASSVHHGAGESHAELLEELDGLRGRSVAVGLYPPWLVDAEDMISAVVPDEHGVVRCGVY